MWSDLTKHAKFFDQLILDLIFIEVKMDNKDMVVCLIYLLPLSYEHLVMTLTRAKETISVSEVTAVLLVHNQCKKKHILEEARTSECMFLEVRYNKGVKHEKHKK